MDGGTGGGDFCSYFMTCNITELIKKTNWHVEYTHEKKVKMLQHNILDENSFCQ